MPHEGPGTDVLPIVMLVLGLIVATWCAVGFPNKTVRRRRGRSRAGLIVVAIVSLVYFGFIREGCICAIGAIQNVSLGLADSSYVVPITAIIFFLLPVGFAIFFGRTFCSGVCPLGALQEVVLLRPVRVPRVVDHVLGLIPFLYLGLGVALAASGTAFLICRYDPFVGIFRMAAPFGMLVFGIGLLLIGLFVGRPYCRYLCPYGALLGIFSRFAKWRICISPSECVQCRLCEESCPYGAIREPTVDRPHNQLHGDRRRLIVALLSLPVLLAVFTYLGYRSTAWFAQLDPVITTAQVVHDAESKKDALSEDALSEDTLLTEPAIEKKISTLDRTEFKEEDTLRAFYESGVPVKTLYASATVRLDRLTIACTCFGVWVALVIGVKLIRLSIRRRRTDYLPNPITCVACGRCFRDCPVEREEV
jgi:ferredoxin